MDFKTVAYYLIFAGVVLVVGAILLVIDHFLQKRRTLQFEMFVDVDLMPRIKAMVVEAISDSMDILPEKILEVKKNIEER